MKKIKTKRLLSMLAGMTMFVSLIPATVMAVPTSVRYVDGNGNDAYTTSDYKVVNETGNVWGTPSDKTWYVVNNNDEKKVIFQDRIEIQGNVNLILNDTTELWAMEGFHVAPGNSLTIYGRSIDLREA